MTKCKTRTEWLDLLHKCQNGDASCMFVLREIERELDVLANLRDEAVDNNRRLVKEQRELERENALLKRVAQLARDAVEAGAVDECYLSLLRDAVSALPNA
jgi:hypothetical protein